MRPEPENLTEFLMSLAGPIDTFLNPPDPLPERFVPLDRAPDEAILREIVDLCEGHDAALARVIDACRPVLKAWGRTVIELYEDEWQLLAGEL